MMLATSSVLQLVPSSFRSSLTRALQVLEQQVPDIELAAVVGSVPQGEWTAASDIDLLFATQYPVDIELLCSVESLLEQTEKHVQLIWFTYDQLLEHFANRTTMAHSLKRGLIIHDPVGKLAGLCAQLSEPPTKKWIREWFSMFDDLYQTERWLAKLYWRRHRGWRQTGECVCLISNTMARVVVNLSILYLELLDIIPTTKQQIRAGMAAVKPAWSPAVELALQARKYDRELTWDEFCLLSRTARELRRAIVPRLVPGD